MLRLKYLIILLVYPGIILSSTGRETTNIDSFKKALLAAKVDSKKIALQQRLFWEYQSRNPDSALYYARQSLQLAQHINHKKSIAESYNNLGTFYRKQGQYDKALKYYKRTLSIRKKLNKPENIAETYSSLGIVHWSQGNYAKAHEYYNKAIKLNKQYNNTAFLADNYNNTGIIFWNQSNYPKALQYFFKSLKLKKKIDDTSGQASTLGNIGLVYMQQDNYDKSLKYHLKAHRLFKKLQKKEDRAISLGNIGNVYLKQEQYSKALLYYRRSLQLRERLSRPKLIGTALNNLGRLFQQVYQQKESHIIRFLQSWEGIDTTGNKPERYNKQKLLDSAYTYLQRALTLRKKIEQKYGICNSLLSLGELFMIQNKYDKALDYYKRSYQLAVQVELFGIQQSASKGLYQCYKKKKDYQRALHWHELYKKHEDSLFSKERQKKLGQLETRYKWQQRQLKDSLQHAKEMRMQKIRHRHQLQQQQTYTYAGIGGFILMLALALTLYRSYRQKRYTNQQLSQKNNIIKKHKQKVEQQNKELMDSINYAQYLQEALLPSSQQLDQQLGSYFILLRPQAKVSGDFYWTHQADGHIFFTVADCTGHGVPGALVSVVGHEALNRCVREYNLRQPNTILNRLTKLVEEYFEKNNKEVKDGMDLALCRWTPENNTLTFAGANNPVYLITSPSSATLKKSSTRFWPYNDDSSYGLLEIKGAPQPIGKFSAHQPFPQHQIQLNAGDTVYLFSDGYPDQFGGPKGKKFMYHRFRRLLLNIHKQPIASQKQELEQTLHNWMAENNQEQIDDICVMGTKIT